MFRSIAKPAEVPADAGCRAWGTTAVGTQLGTGEGRLMLNSSRSL